MKARKVKGLDRDTPLAQNAARIVLVRLSELRELGANAKAADAAESIEALHDTRIAAKRLRYVLETTGFCFGEAGDEARNAARELQGILGDLHDCDELLPEIDDHVAALRAEDALSVRTASNGDNDLDPALAAKAPNRSAYRGLATLGVHTRARRQLMLERFDAHWADYEASGVWQRLKQVAKELKRAS